MILADPEATEAAGHALAELLRPGDVVALAGPLGAGKTSLARGVLRGLGFTGEAPSPSFAIALFYEPPELRLPVAHVDLYRLDDPADAVELGLDEAGEEGVLIVEWPERLGAEAWPQALRLTLAPAADGARRLTWIAPLDWEGRWPPPHFPA